MHHLLLSQAPASLKHEPCEHDGEVGRSGMKGKMKAFSSTPCPKRLWIPLWIQNFMNNNWINGRQCHNNIPAGWGQLSGGCVRFPGLIRRIPGCRWWMVQVDGANQMCLLIGSGRSSETLQLWACHPQVPRPVTKPYLSAKPVNKEGLLYTIGVKTVIHNYSPDLVAIANQVIEVYHQ